MENGNLHHPGEGSRKSQREIAYMGYYCGIDLGNKRTVICILDEKRRVKAELEISTSAASLGKALKAYKKLKFIVEAAPLAEWVCTEVEKLGHSIFIVCARKANHKAGALPPRELSRCLSSL